MGFWEKQEAASRVRREASFDVICLLSAFLSQPWPRPSRNKLSWREVGRVLLRVVFVTADSPVPALGRCSSDSVTSWAALGLQARFALTCALETQKFDMRGILNRSLMFK